MHHHVTLDFQCRYGRSDEGGVKIGIVRREVRFLEDGRKWILPGLLYADDLVLRGESEEKLKVVVGRFADVCKRGPKPNTG